MGTTNCVFHYLGGSDASPPLWVLEYPVGRGIISNGCITNDTIAIQFFKINHTDEDDDADFQYLYKRVYSATFLYGNGVFIPAKANRQ